MDDITAPGSPESTAGAGLPDDLGAGPGRPDDGRGFGDDPVRGFRDSSLSRWRGGASAIMAVTFIIFGVLISAGFLAGSDEDVLENARPADLVQILDSLENDIGRLTQQRRSLEDELAELESGTSKEALDRATQRLRSLQVLAGTEPVTGPGIEIRIQDPDRTLDYSDVLNAVQELRDAGAESIEFAERRVVVNTWFANAAQNSGILVSGDLRKAPYRLLAIGDPDTLATAMQIPGGVADSLRTGGAEVEIKKRESLSIDSTVPLEKPTYAEPVTTD